MNKSELTKAVTDKKPYRTRAGEVEEIINTTLDEIRSALAKGEKVALKGFGTFEAVTRAARPGRNPKTGEEIQIPAHTAVKFKPSKKLLGEEA